MFLLTKEPKSYYPPVNYVITAMHKLSSVYTRSSSEYRKTKARNWIFVDGISIVSLGKLGKGLLEVWLC